MVVDAAADALNNKEIWEKELRERQRLNPDVEMNSFLNDAGGFELELQLI